MKNPLVPALAGGLGAEVLMVLGYLLFEGVLYGFKTALLSVPFNAIQGGIGLAVGVALIVMISKSKILK